MVPKKMKKIQIIYFMYFFQIIYFISLKGKKLIFPQIYTKVCLSSCGNILNYNMFVLYKLVTETLPITFYPINVSYLAFTYKSQKASADNCFLNSARGITMNNQSSLLLFEDNFSALSQCHVYALH